MKVFFTSLLIFIISITTLFFIYRHYSQNPSEKIFTEIPLKENSQNEPLLDDETIQGTDENLVEDNQTFTVSIKNENYQSPENTACPLNFQKTYPIIIGANKEIETDLNKKIENIFQSQLINEIDDYDLECDGESTEELSYNLLTLNDKVFSFEKNTYSYMNGAAHPNGSSNYYHFNLHNGAVILFTDLLKKEADLNSLYNLILTALNEKYTDFADNWWIETADDILNQNTQFYIMEEKLYIHFNPYDIAAYAVGPIKIYFEMEELNDFLNSEILELWQ